MILWLKLINHSKYNTSFWLLLLLLQAYLHITILFLFCLDFDQKLSKHSPMVTVHHGIYALIIYLLNIFLFLALVEDTICSCGCSLPLTIIFVSSCIVFISRGKFNITFLESKSYISLDFILKQLVSLF